MPAKPSGPCVPLQPGAVRENLLDPCCSPLRIDDLTELQEQLPCRYPNRLVLKRVPNIQCIRSLKARCSAVFWSLSVCGLDAYNWKTLLSGTSEKCDKLDKRAGR